MSLQKSSSFAHDVNIFVEGRQFDANWSVLRENSVVFEEFYSRRKTERGLSQDGGKAVDSVYTKGIRAGLVGTFLRYVNDDTGQATKQRQLVLKEIKDVIVFSVLFQLRDLRNLMYTECLQDLDANLNETGFGRMSKLHQALLRFLFDRTTIYRTRKIAMFLAYEAYKEANLECLVGVLKTLGDHQGTRVEMRLKLLDIAIAMFSTGVEVPGRIELMDDDFSRVLSEETGRQKPARLRVVPKNARADTDVGGKLVPRRLFLLPSQEYAGDIPRSKKHGRKGDKMLDTNCKNEVAILNPTFSNGDNDREIEDTADCKKIRKNVYKKTIQELSKKKPLVQRPGMASSNGRANVSKKRQKLTKEQPPEGRPESRGRKKETLKAAKSNKTRVGNNKKHKEVRAKSTTTEVTQKTIVEHETRVIRNNVRKLWTEPNSIPVILSSNNEERPKIQQPKTKQPEVEKPEVKYPEVKQPGVKHPETKQPEVKQPEAKHIEVKQTEVRRTRDVEILKLLIPEAETRAESSGLYEELGRVSHRLRSHHSIFITGGIQKNDYFARRVVLEFDPINNIYITHRAMRATRYNHGIAQVNGDLYVVGGNSGCFEQLRTVESYSVERAQWSSQASMREARDEFSLAVCGGCMYAIGGHNGIHDLRTVEKFESEEHLWSFVAPMKSFRAGSCSVAVEDRYIYVTGGFNGQDYTNTVERYDITADTWTEIEPMSNKRAYSCLVLSQHNMYVLGGFDGNVTLSACETYDTHTRTWSPVPDMNTARMNATSVVFNENVFIFGGENDSVFLESVECYDILNKTWGFIQRLPQPMAGLRACVYLEEVPPTSGTSSGE